jgi:flagellin-specific chaperone FliS
MEKTKVEKVNMSISINKRVAEVLKEVADDLDMSVSEIIEHAMQEYYNFYAHMLFPIKRKTAKDIFDSMEKVREEKKR